MDEMHSKAMSNVLQQIIDLAKEGLVGQMSPKNEEQAEAQPQDVSADTEKLKTASVEE